MSKHRFKNLHDAHLAVEDVAYAINTPDKRTANRLLKKAKQALAESEKGLAVAFFEEVAWRHPEAIAVLVEDRRTAELAKAGIQAYLAGKFTSEHPEVVMALSSHNGSEPSSHAPCHKPSLSRGSVAIF